ncbi:nucleotide-diphospho-sugar transferase [Methylotuvimicrobium sp. KM1]|uniref:nucleotide-diphospho-sugar transferase n=1 Tax=Methylotuvimicrobium sp. KM1 TaxID=3377707 RepID=UPI003850632C
MRWFKTKSEQSAVETSKEQETVSPAILNTAVLFLVFNRPDTTRQVFEAIRKAKPPRLYIAADGAREKRKGEAEKVAKVREIATAVDWPCEVMTLFRDDNLGCKSAVSSAITWFFEHEDQGIILEDDCLPHSDFFNFCDNLLNRYTDDERVWVITGNNFQNGRKRGEASYYFSKYNHCWGWATWRRAWQHYQGELPFWIDWKRSEDWQHKMPDPVEQRYWRAIFERVRAGQIDSWAYPWTASVWYRGGLTATPNVNLVSNIGFGAESTHTSSVDSPLANMSTAELGDLIHPNDVLQNIEADRYVFDNAFGGRNIRLPWSLLKLPRRLASFAYRKLKRGVCE